MSQWMPDRILNDLLEQISSRRFPYKGRNRKKVNWAAYNRARIECLEGVLYLIRSSVDNVKLIEIRNRGQGRPPKHSARDKAKAVLLAELFQADERTASGLVNLFREKLGIAEEMSPRTIGRAYYDPDVRYILQELLKQSNEYIKGKAKSFSGDSTGMKKTHKGNWERDKDDGKLRAGFDMLSIMVSNEFHVVSACMLESGPINDAPRLKPLAGETLAMHKAESMQFDANFLSRENVQWLVEHGVEPYIMPKKNCSLKARGCLAYHRMLWNAVTDPQNFLWNYHMRSNVESVNSSIKRFFVKPLRRRELAGRNTEVLARIVLHNFMQLIVAHYEGRVELEIY